MNSLLLAVGTGLAAGLGCGACASPALGLFLSAYVISGEGGALRGLGKFTAFLAGRIVSACALCAAASLAGSCVVGADGYAGPVNARLLAQCAMSLFGIAMLVRYARRLHGAHKGGACGKGSCGRRAESLALPAEDRGAWGLFASGVLYGALPCPPTVAMAVYAASVPLPAALAGAAAFGASSLMSPLLVVAILMGVLSRKIRADIPGCLPYFRIASYALLAAAPFFV